MVPVRGSSGDTLGLFGGLWGPFPGAGRRLRPSEDPYYASTRARPTPGQVATWRSDRVGILVKYKYAIALMRRDGTDIQVNYMLFVMQQAIAT